MRSKGSSSVLPAGPLRELIDLRMQQYARPPLSDDELARVVATRLEKSFAAADRALVRIRSTESVTVGLADEWCTALRTHVGEVYGWDVYDDPFMERSA